MNAWLNDLALVSALGADNSAHLDALSGEQHSGLAQVAGLDNEGMTPYLGQVANLPLDSTGRNNAMIDLALAQLTNTLDKLRSRVAAHRIAVIIGTSTADIYDGERARAQQARHGSWPDHYHYHQQSLDAPAQYIRDKLALEGPCYSISTACSSSSKALSSAKAMLQAGLADAVICGGADSLCQLTVNGFKALASTSAGICQPFAQQRDGINIGEGVGLFIMTRSADFGSARCALLGCGSSSDAYHMSAPEPQGQGAIAAMHQALAEAALTATDIDYINAHGTATVKNDAMEARAIADVIGAQTPVSSSKHLTGHTLGAAGAIEAGLCWLLIEQQRLGKTLTLPYHSGYALDASLATINLVQQPTRERPKTCMSNSFAFGGNNASIIIGEIA
ncbi:beta-ketoacyl-[acyl-carrier-protein] synthase II [Pseudoalteromonas ruthenica]|uniref:beta-ketoacyl-ACP synthase n=1 Tax=Pseudoalteromonas ruthenica TaxID=151081 RepID=UPI0011093D71|nr:beta-ketoacyl-ACP synthase [Pseudoalteromonas ruthenica]TLX51894.1 beta-ketoacyl-[acyl-carrier-protein] synthase II [Pseudoalteromonas ruthenica]